LNWTEILQHYDEITGIHPAADLFPMVEGDELLELCADIKERGLQQPIVIWRDGTVLDGRNRLMACYRTNQEVVLDRYEGDDPVQFSLSANLHRRHLNQGQKAMVALKVEEIFAAEAKERHAAAVAESNKRRAQDPSVANLPLMAPANAADALAIESAAQQAASDVLAGRPTPGLPTSEQRALLALEVAHQLQPPALKSRDQAAAVVGASGRSVQMAKAVTKAAPDLAEKVERGAMPLHRAYREVQERALSEPPPEEVKWSKEELDRRRVVEAGGTVVANMHSGKDEYLLRWARSTDRFVRIDRSSEWGNPYEMPGDGDRETVCKSFEIYFSRKLSLHIKIGSLAGKVLGCWCYPEQCHGSYLASQVKRRADADL
jgi:ParB-like chromosome segregation protein Spo0J